MTTYNLSAFAGAGAQFFDDNGAPLVGGKLYSYAAGTTTLLTTYTTNAGTVANTNPIILNAGGRTPNEIWQATGILLKFVLYTATDELIGTYDGIPSINDPFGINSQLSSVAGTNTITATATPTLTAYATGSIYSFIAANTNTGAVTLSIDGLTAKSVTKNGSVALSAGDIQSGKMMLVEYDGTAFQLINNIVYGGSITNGTIVSLTSPMSVPNGGTGLATLTTNNVVLGNGAAAVNFVAPGTSGNLLTSNGTTWTSATPAIVAPTAIGQVPFSTDGSTYTATQKIAMATAASPVSGSAINFTSIPSWAKRVTVMFNAVVKSGTSNLLVQLGSGSVTSSGYLCVNPQWYSPTGYAFNTPATNGFAFFSNIAANSLYGTCILTLVNEYTWTAMGSLATTASTATLLTATGGVTLSGALDRVRITSSAGTETFSVGTINIMYE
jgi:hypothetical protein